MIECFMSRQSLVKAKGFHVAIKTFFCRERVSYSGVVIEFFQNQEFSYCDKVFLCCNRVG